MNDSNRNNKNNNRKRNNRRRPNKNTDGNKSGSDNKRRRNPRNRRPKSLTPSRLLQKYDNLLEQHLIARRKYFEMFGRASGKQFDKIEKNFHRTLKELRDFEANAKDWQKEVLDQKINPYPEDRQYSTEHELGEVEYVPFDGDYEDPHLLPTQKSQNWAEDTEESSGSMDDYYNYKGIEPPVIINESDSDKVK
jgi:hypothetical protein